MSVQGIGNHAAHQLPQEMRGIQKQEPVSAPVLQNDTDKPSKQSGLPEYDEYIPGEKREPIGLYKLTHDDEGNPIIEFDDPMKADNVSPQEAEGPSKEAAPAKGEPGRKAETCTTNTDKVDREIEKLKEERDQLEQQIRTTKDPDKAEDLKRQLAQRIIKKPLFRRQGFRVLSRIQEPNGGFEIANQSRRFPFSKMEIRMVY